MMGRTLTVEDQRFMENSKLKVYMVELLAMEIGGRVKLWNDQIATGSPEEALKYFEHYRTTVPAPLHFSSRVVGATEYVPDHMRERYRNSVNDAAERLKG